MEDRIKNDIIKQIKNREQRLSDAIDAKLKAISQVDYWKHQIHILIKEIAVLKDMI